jgi:uroporphyrinogen-III decarboxylase
MEGDPQSVRKASGILIERFGDLPNYVLGTGCDLPGETPLENIDALMAMREAAGA